MLHRHTHPTTGAAGGWHDANMAHADISKHLGPIQTKDANGVISGTVAEPLKGYVPANPRGPRGSVKLSVEQQIINADMAEALAEQEALYAQLAALEQEAKFNAMVEAAVEARLASMKVKV